MWTNIKDFIVRICPGEVLKFVEKKNVKKLFCTLLKVGFKGPTTDFCRHLFQCLHNCGRNLDELEKTNTVHREIVNDLCE